ncbi:RNA polymerase sigma factor, sigma-70 family [Geodermatophilus siccatus]|uniref:RNA polymerase sigma factor, sigma-70 family n=1 Tax=Geodermatophilus siccatus TaxID=1137991 RepID=A0A1G9NG69_9ACTN|nr:sigma-70 family RNA polymerase sigma factor [Geodermatophilus siccatus]SDL85410.1 RNA polymerase sigma factor, sigma-70 family [Geodermatophilus siccatus]
MATQLCRTTAHAARGCDNATLLAQVAAGDQSAWRRLIDEYDGLVRSVAASFRLQTADVHDVAQTTWLRLLQNVRTIRDPERLAGWLAVTASRESLALLRRSARLRPLPMVDETPDATAGPEEDVIDRDEARDLWAAVAELPPRQQRLLVALFRDELDSYNDVAARCAMPVGSIGPTRARALSRLRSKLADRGLGPAVA